MRHALLLLVLLAAPVRAQFGPAADPCPLGTAEGVLRGADVQASLFTNGNLFFGNATTNGDGYLVPLGQIDLRGLGPPSPVFAGALWLSGVVSGEVRASAARYTGFAFRPGFTGRDGTPPTPAECAAADRVWVVSRDDVAAYLAGAFPTADLAEWPAHLGAPVLDGDGVEGNYNLAEGDQPALRGDVMAWWAMTDTATDLARLGGSGAALGVDVAVEAYAVRQAPFGRDTFYRFTVTNRNSVPIEDAYLGMFYDSDLGDASDDYIGTDTTAQVVYTYNADNADEAYGIPPAVGVVLAEGPVGLPNGRDDDQDGEVDEPGERIGLTHSPMILKGSNRISSDPSTAQDYHYRLQGLFNDGSPIHARGVGFLQPETVLVARVPFPADPAAGQFWSEVNATADGRSNPTGDRRAAVPVGPFRLEPGEAAAVSYAVVFAQGEDHLQSVTLLRRKATVARSAVRTGALDPARVSGTPVPTPLSVRRPFPNPFTDTARMEVRGLTRASGATMRVSVFDVLGRRVAAPLTVTASGPVEVGRGLPAGVYLVRVDGVGFSETMTVVKTR